MTGHVEDEPGDAGHDEGDPDKTGYPEYLGGDTCICRCIAAERSCAGIDETETVDDFHHREGCDKRRNIQVSDKEAGDGSERCRNDHDDEQNQPRVQRSHTREELAGIVNLLKQGSRKACGETDHTTCGEVAAAGDNAACDTKRDNDTVAHVRKNVCEVIHRKEVFGC